MFIGYENETLPGRLTKVSLTGGWLWSRSYSAIDYAIKGHSKAIKNECWGVESVVDGYILGCGTGIENCPEDGSAFDIACSNGTVDSREGAFSRVAGVWQSLIIKADLSGVLDWQRVDQFRPGDAPALGEPGWQRRSSASEYVIPTPDGGFYSVNDEVSGIGILKLGPPPSAVNATEV